MALITLQNVTIHFRGPALLDDVSCQIESGQRIGLLGRNGTGKTTLMRMIRGNLQPDHGAVSVSPGKRVALLPQEVPQDVAGTVSEVITSVPPDGEPADQDDWRHQNSAEHLLKRMSLDGDARFETLSSGMKRRVLLARALVSDPDVLLLDEPTNHLDLDAILWLETFLARWKATLMFVTHDRMFLRTLATRILEIDRGRLFDWSCDYDTFLARKEQALVAQEKQDALFDKKLAQEEIWIRQGIKARRTRNEGRVRALKSMRQERNQRRGDPGQITLRIQEAQRSGTLVAGLKEISFSYPDQQIVNGFSTTVFRGDKIGIIGPNGAGKTTLLRLLLGELAPDAGTVRIGSNVQIAYFDQLREQLDEEQTVQHNVGDGYETVHVGGKPQHIIGYLQKFLFSPEQARTPVKFLSGGERNRILLAKLFTKPANVIVLDEPTNDLDAESLELLEQQLVTFQGTVLLVSHDREFLNNVVTSTLVFEQGSVQEYDGGYNDWLRQRHVSETPTKPRDRNHKNSAGKSLKKTTPPSGKRRLSYKEQQELTGLPAKIEQLESRIAETHQLMATTEYYQQPGEQIASRQARLDAMKKDLAAAYQRWEKLE
jgi:ATP-binding cassette subfamily F protein uup